MTESNEKTLPITCRACGFVHQTKGLTALTTFKCEKCQARVLVPGKLGDLLLSDILGAGAMGLVFRGTDMVLSRDVAVKLMKPSKNGKSQQTAEQYINEARAQARINHPNVAQIFSAGWLNDQPYIVMELIEGGRLNELISKEKQLPEIRALEIAIQVTRGLQAALNSKILHRDVKPSNVLIDKDGNAKLVDFGLAKFEGDGEEGGAGTATYLAPENIRRPDNPKPTADHRADMYSLGVTLYQMLAGEPPFMGTTVQEKIDARFKGPAKSISVARGDVSLETAALIAKLLKLKPEERFATYDDLLKDMEAAKTAAVNGPAELDLFAEAPNLEKVSSELEPAKFILPTTTEPVPYELHELQAPEVKKRPAWLIPAIIAAGVVFLLSGIGFAVYYALSSSQAPVAKALGGAQVVTPTSGPAPATTTSQPTTQQAAVPPAPPPPPPPPPPTPDKLFPVTTAPTAVPKPQPVKPALPVYVPVQLAQPNLVIPKVDPIPVATTKPAAPPPEEKKRIVYIDKGVVKSGSVIMNGGDWTSNKNFVVNSDASKWLALAAPIGKGDFKFKANLKFAQIAPNGGSSISIGNLGKIVFASRTGNGLILLSVDGKLGGGSHRDVGITTKYLKAEPDGSKGTQPFVFTVTRTGSAVFVAIDGRTFFLRVPYNEESFGTITITPGKDKIQISDMDVDFTPPAPPAE